MQSAMASLMRVMSSSRESACEWHPRNVGTDAT